jgi:hypothetical protein
MFFFFCDDDSADPNNNVTNVSEPVPTPANKPKWPKNFKHQNITVQIMNSKQQQIEIVFHMLKKKKTSLHSIIPSRSVG